jgi:hypothetical protein
LPYDPAIPLLEIYPMKCDSGYYKSTCTPMFIAALFTIAKLWKQPRCPTTDEWSKKMWYLYTMEFYSATQVNGWNWRTSSKVKLVRLRRPKITCSPLYADYRLKKCSNIMGHKSHTKGRPCTGGIEKRK